MHVALRWQGGLPDAAALARLHAEGHDVALALVPDDVVPDFLLEDQAAALGIATAARATLSPTSEDAAEGPGRWRAFLCAVAPPLGEDALGRFVEDVSADDLREAPHRTFVIEGAGFSRRVEAMAGDVVPWNHGWRLSLGLRGC